MAEELCRLFASDDGVDMTPILRRSKESARKQRMKPEGDKKSVRPSRPLPVGRGRFPSGPPSSDRYDRKRRYDDGYAGPPQPPSRPKYRYDDRDDRNYGSPYPGGSSGRNPRVSRSYDDYLRTVRHNDYPDPYYSRSYDKYAADYSRSYDRRNYDRSVDEFLRRTSGGGGDSSRDRDRRFRR